MANYLLLFYDIFSVERAHLVPNKENVCKGKIPDTILPNKELTFLHTKTKDAMRSSRPSTSRHHTTIMSSGKLILNLIFQFCMLSIIQVLSSSGYAGDIVYIETFSS